jgi:hypothetical protein
MLFSFQYPKGEIEAPLAAAGLVAPEGTAGRNPEISRLI